MRIRHGPATVNDYYLCQVMPLNIPLSMDDGKVQRKDRKSGDLPGSSFTNLLSRESGGTDAHQYPLENKEYKNI